jgi:menaquinone-specific isochorismate synthase
VTFLHPSDTDRLRWRSWALDSTPDLVAIGARPGGFLWQREDFAIAGVGVALRLELSKGLGDPEGVAAAEAALGAIGRADEQPEGKGAYPGGEGPIAVGALPFDRSTPAGLVVPATVVVRRGDRTSLVMIHPTSSSAMIDPGVVIAGLESGADHRFPPDAFSLSTTMPQQQWAQLVAETVAAIGAGRMAKVVLARRVDVEANRPFVLPDVLERLGALYPACTLFHAEGFIGASPELLIERRGDMLRCLPLAGTVARSGDMASDQHMMAGLLGSPKERAEHRFVIDDLAAALAPWCDELDVPDQPEVLALRNVSHLATRITGRLSSAAALSPRSVPSALALAALVHPTAAVAGVPRHEALSYQRAVEGFERGRYGGPVGWFDQAGNGSWALGLRCAAIDGPRAQLYAGVGVVAGSDPGAELAETQLKLQAMLAALVRP